MVSTGERLFQRQPERSLQYQLERVRGRDVAQDALHARGGHQPGRSVCRAVHVDEHDLDPGRVERVRRRHVGAHEGKRHSSRLRRLGAQEELEPQCGSGGVRGGFAGSGRAADGAYAGSSDAHAATIEQLGPDDAELDLGPLLTTTTMSTIITFTTDSFSLSGHIYLGFYRSFLLPAGHLVSFNSSSFSNVTRPFFLSLSRRLYHGRTRSGGRSCASRL